MSIDLPFSVYNDLGETIRTGLDVDGNGALDPSSSDRITESESKFKKIDSDWWQESVSRIYAEENSATPKNTGLSRSRLTGLGSANLTAESESFDINGNKSSSKTFTDSTNKTVTSQVNAAGWAQPSITVSKYGVAVSSKDQAGIEVSFEYDSLGRKIKTKDPRTGASITHFDAKGRVDYVADAAGFKTEFGYDETTGRKVWEKNASGKFTRYSYDVKGRITKTWGDSVYPVSYSYDETGRMVSMTTYRADAGWNAESFPENATGDTTKWHYDPATGLLLAKEYADGTKTEYKYAEAGRLDSRIWARKNGANAVSTSYVYDPSTASLNKIDYSDETADIVFAYDRLGRQKSITDAVGTRIFSYNDSFQLWKESIDGLTPATITRLYETDGVKGRPAGFIVSSSTSKSKNLPQEGQGEDNSSSLPLPLGEGWGEGKNAEGKSGSLEYQISYGYDPSGRIRTLSWNAGGKADSATYDYVENSHLLSGMKTGSGFAASYSYEEHRNVKTAVSNSFGNTAVSTYTYEYDELGRRKSVKNTGPAFTNPNFNIYGYNDRSEVTASSSFTGEDLANKNNPLSDRGRAYNYDPIGNRKTASEAASNFAYSANSLNQYESISGAANPETPAYDLDGNMTVAQGMVYSYNAENRLVEASPQNPQQGSIKSTYIYDYMGRRAIKNLYTYSSGSWQKQKDVSFIYDGWNMVKESEKTSDSSPEVPVYYLWGLDLSQSMQGAGGVGGLIASVKSGNEYLFSFDANGNVGQMVKSSDGSIAARYEYDPFGKTLFAEGQMAGENTYRFSTKYQDVETSFYYYGFRYYDVKMGRWINRDPMKETDGGNIYSFLRNKPINLFDVLGLWGTDVHQGLTTKWAETYFKSSPAATIGYYDESIDGGNTGPIPGFLGLLFGQSGTDQRYHFDRSGGGKDSRRVLFEEHNKKAKDCCNWAELGNDDPLNAVVELGKSLHPLQDIIAHGDFGKRTEGTVWYWHNLLSLQWVVDPVNYLFKSMAPLVDDINYDAEDGIYGSPSGNAMHTMINAEGYVIEWAKFMRGSKRIQKTEDDTREVLKEFKKHLEDKSKGGNACKCRAYFLEIGMVPMDDNELKRR